MVDVQSLHTRLLGLKDMVNAPAVAVTDSAGSAAPAVAAASSTSAALPASPAVLGTTLEPEGAATSLKKYEELKDTVPVQTDPTFIKIMSGKSKKSGNATSLCEVRKTLELALTKVNESIRKDGDDAPLQNVELSAKLKNAVLWCRATVFSWALQVILQNPHAKKRDEAGKTLRANLLTLMNDVTSTNGDVSDARLIDAAVLKESRELLAEFPAKQVASVPDAAPMPKRRRAKA